MKPSPSNASRKMLLLWIVVPSLLLLTTPTKAASYRRGASTSDSILEIINTQEVERLLAARKLNNSRAERRYLAQNDLDEDFLEPNPQAILYEPPEHNNDYEKHKPRDSGNRIGIDVLLKQYNTSFQSPELLAELGYNGHKLLKSSKNALIVTKKQYLKKDWCKTEPLVQRVKEDKCITRTVINRFCYGQCNSFYIPKNPRRRRTKPPLAPEDERDDLDQTGAAFKSCTFCKPKKFIWISVRLECPTLTPPYRIKRIQRIRQCKCTTVDVN